MRLGRTWLSGLSAFYGYLWTGPYRPQNINPGTCGPVPVSLKISSDSPRLSTKSAHSKSSNPSQTYPGALNSALDPTGAGAVEGGVVSIGDELRVGPLHLFGIVGFGQGEGGRGVRLPRSLT